MLNPATITLTGALAVRAVAKRIDDRLSVEHRFGTQPDVVALDKPEDQFIRAKGAALALLRNKVHRRLPELLTSNKYNTSQNIDALTIKLDNIPLPNRNGAGRR